MPSATGGSGGGVGFASDSNFKNIYTRLMYRFNLERDKESRNSVQAAGPTGPRDHTFLSLGGFYLYGDSLQRFKWGAEVRSNELLATFRHVVTSLYGLVGARRVLIGAGVRRSHFRRDCIIASFNCIVLKINALVHASRLGFKGMPIALLVVSSEGSVMHLRFDRQGITVSCRSLIARVGALALLTLPYSGALNAASIVVTGDSSGFFGTPTIGAKLLTQGVVVSSPAQIVVKATGTVFDFNDQGRFLSVTPNGVDFTSIYGDVLPLQEAQGIPGNTPTTILDALMGTFVPAATAMLPNFIPKDSDEVSPGQVGIDASSLFFIGAGPFTFNAPGAGTLYLGINDSFVADNSGDFLVTVSTVPEPGNASLLIVGLSAVVWARGRRSRSRTTLRH